MTSCRVYAYGLIAGMSLAEMKQLTPGMIISCYQIRQDYDMAMFRLTKKKRGGEW